jgi:ATP-binding cassette subfamily B protein
MTPKGVVGAPEAARHLRTAVRLAWSAAPVTASVYCGVSLLTAAGPVTAAALARALIDRLSLATAVGLAAVGLLAAVATTSLGYLRERLLRLISCQLHDRLYAVLANQSGIARLEDPRFREELRRARGSGPGRVVDEALRAAVAFLVGATMIALVATVHRGLSALLLISAVAAYAARPSGRGEPVEPGYFAEVLVNPAAAKEVRLLRLADLFRSRMREQARDANESRSRLDGRALRTSVALVVVAAGSAGAALAWGVRLPATAGDLALLTASAVVTYGAAQAMARHMEATRSATAMFRDFRALEAVEADLPEPEPPAPAAGLSESIELVDVWFRYAPDRPWVLRGVTFTIPCGQSVALVGLNGAGKSTLIKLLCRFYDPTLGSIRWDGRDIRHMRAEELRARIGAVFQDFMRFDLSAAENIGVGDVATLGDPAPVQRAARLAGVHDMVAALPSGYDTPLSDAQLSGGQWQRVAMARAFLRDDADLMILDEPLSGLDAYAEYELHQRLRERRAGRTSLLISHRLGTVRDADLIVVLADGKVAESGRHADLLARGGGYADLFRWQAAGYAGEPA